MYHIEQQLNKISKIEDDLFLTSYDGVQNNKLHRRGITHIIDLTNRNYTIDNVTILHLMMHDNEQQPLDTLIPKTNQFIEAALKQNGKILIHCEQGISRSPAILCAWMIYRDSNNGSFDGYDRIIKIIQAARSIVQPNAGFVRQLKDYALAQTVHTSACCMAR